MSLSCLLIGQREQALDLAARFYQAADARAVGDLGVPVEV
jgi:hypothetical protein